MQLVSLLGVLVLLICVAIVDGTTYNNGQYNPTTSLSYITYTSTYISTAYYVQSAAQTAITYTSYIPCPTTSVQTVTVYVTCQPCNQPAVTTTTVYQQGTSFTAPPSQFIVGTTTVTVNTTTTLSGTLSSSTSTETVGGTVYVIVIGYQSTGVQGVTGTAGLNMMGGTSSIADDKIWLTLMTIVSTSLFLLMIVF